MGLTGLYELISMNRGPTRQTFTDLVTHTVEEQVQCKSPSKGKSSIEWRYAWERGLHMGEVEIASPDQEIGLSVQDLLQKKAKEAVAARELAQKQARRPKVVRRAIKDAKQTSTQVVDDATLTPTSHKSQTEVGDDALVDTHTVKPDDIADDASQKPDAEKRQSLISEKLKGLRNTMKANLPHKGKGSKNFKHAKTIGTYVASAQHRNTEKDPPHGLPHAHTTMLPSSKGTAPESTSSPSPHPHGIIKSKTVHLKVQQSSVNMKDDPNTPLSQKLLAIQAMTAIADAAGVDVGIRDDEDPEPLELPAVTEEEPLSPSVNRSESESPKSPESSKRNSKKATIVATKRKTSGARKTPSLIVAKPGASWDVWSAMMTMPRSRPTLKSRKGCSAKIMEELAKEPVPTESRTRFESPEAPTQETRFERNHSERVGHIDSNDKVRDEMGIKLASFGSNDRLDDHPVYAKFSILQKSSQKGGAQHDAANLCLEGESADGLGWTSQGHPMQWLVLDFATPVELCGIKIIVPGTIGDPKDICIQSGQTPEGPWVPMKRFCLQSGPRQKTKVHVVPFDGGGRYQYYRLLVMRNWGAGSCVNICAPLQFQQVVGTGIDEEVRQKLSGMVTHFCEATVLTHEDREFREFTRARGINLIAAEEIRSQFVKFDTNQSGTIEYEEFKEVIKCLLQAKTVSDIPDNRCKHFWNEVDSDNSGTVSLEEFVLWFHTLFYADNIKNNPTREKSRHNANNRGSMVERFYCQFGAGRCGPLMQELKKKELLAIEEEKKTGFEMKEPGERPRFANTTGGTGGTFRQSMASQGPKASFKDAALKLAGSDSLAKTI